MMTGCGVMKDEKDDTLLGIRADNAKFWENSKGSICCAACQKML